MINITKLELVVYALITFIILSLEMILAWSPSNQANWHTLLTKIGCIAYDICGITLAVLFFSHTKK